MVAVLKIIVPFDRHHWASGERNFEPRTFRILERMSKQASISTGREIL